MLKMHIDARIGEYCGTPIRAYYGADWRVGEMGIDFWDKQRWADEIDSNDIVR